MNTYQVTVTRTPWATRTFEIEADSQAEAERLALTGAPNESFINSGSEYEVEKVSAMVPTSQK